MQDAINEFTGTPEEIRYEQLLHTFIYLFRFVMLNVVYSVRDPA